MYTKMKIEKVQQIWFISISVWNPKDVIIIFHCNCKQLLIYFCVWRRIMFVGSLSFFFSRLSIEANFNLIELKCSQSSERLLTFCKLAEVYLEGMEFIYKIFEHSPRIAISQFEKSTIFLLPFRFYVKSISIQTNWNS